MQFQRFHILFHLQPQLFYFTFYFRYFAFYFP